MIGCVGEISRLHNVPDMDIYEMATWPATLLIRSPSP